MTDYLTYLFYTIDQHYSKSIITLEKPYTIEIFWKKSSAFDSLDFYMFHWLRQFSIGNRCYLSW